MASISAIRHSAAATRVDGTNNPAAPSNSSAPVTVTSAPFADRCGLFTALATEGFQLLTEALVDARGDFTDAALAYVRFAIDHPGHYEEMFDKSLLDVSDPGLAVNAQVRAIDPMETVRRIATMLFVG